MNNLAYSTGGNFCLGNAGLAEGTNAATVQIATAFNYCVDGVVATKAITDNVALTACALQADLTTCLYLLTINGGTVTCTKGEEVLTADLTKGLVSLEWPSAPAGAVFGGIKVKNIAGTFTAGTTDLGAATVTDTYYNLMSVPTARITS